MALIQIRWCHDALEKNLNGHQLATVRITLRKVFADLERDEKRRAALEEENNILRKALIGHRSDLHQASRRPCPTCRESALALGIEVPYRCAQWITDKRALDALTPATQDKE